MQNARTWGARGGGKGICEAPDVWGTAAQKTIHTLIDIYIYIYTHSYTHCDTDLTEGQQELLDRVTRRESRLPCETRGRCSLNRGSTRAIDAKQLCDRNVLRFVKISSIIVPSQRA